MIDNFTQNGAQQGWQCPICKRVLSPWTPECPCGGQGMMTYTTVTWKDVIGVNSNGERR